MKPTNAQQIKKPTVHSCEQILYDELKHRRRHFGNCSLALPLKYILVVGRVVGILPMHTYSKHDHDNTKTFDQWIGRLGSITGTILLGLSALFTLGEFFYNRVGEKVMRAGLIAHETRNLLFFTNGFFTYCYFLVRNTKFRALFKTWEETIQNLVFQETDLRLNRVIWFVSGLVMVSALIGFLLFNAKLHPWLSSHYHEDDPFPVWQAVVWRYHKLRSKPLPFNIWLDSFLLCNAYLSFISSSFSDLLIMLLARAIWFRFTALTRAVQYALVDNGSTIIKRGGEHGFWKDIRSDHLRLSSLVSEFESFLSPLVIISFTQNLYSLCLQVHEAMLPSRTRSGFESADAFWTTCHLLLRMTLVTYFGAGLNDAAHEINLPMQKWPTQNYCAEMERLERYLGSIPIGLSGLGCFILSRPFLIVMFSIIFTIEIVLLQATAADLTRT